MTSTDSAGLRGGNTVYTQRPQGTSEEEGGGVRVREGRGGGESEGVGGGVRVREGGRE